MDKISKEELKELLSGTNGEHYYFDRDTTFIREQNITVNQGGNLYVGGQTAKKSTDKDKESEQLVLQLMPIFLDNELEAEAFLKEINGKSALKIVELVKEYRKESKVDERLCHHSLWKILSDKGIYPLSERNWNERIKYNKI